MLIQSAAREACQEAFPPPSFSSAHDNIGDLAIVQLSEAIIDDFPTADPRWAESALITGGFTPCHPNLCLLSIYDSLWLLGVTGDSHSVIIQYQLEDKKFAHEKFQEFLRSVDLWKLCCSVCSHGNPRDVQMILCEHGEKVSCALALKQVHTHLSQAPRKQV